MDQLESQINDIRYLTGSPGHPAAGNGQPPPSGTPQGSMSVAVPGDTPAPPGSVYSPDAPLSAKRKPDDDDAGAKQQRSKRNRVSRAHRQKPLSAPGIGKHALTPAPISTSLSHGAFRPPPPFPPFQPPSPMGAPAEPR